MMLYELWSCYTGEAYRMRHIAIGFCCFGKATLSRVMHTSRVGAGSMTVGVMRLELGYAIRSKD